MVNNAVEVRDLVVRRGGRPVLPGVSCSVRTGSITGLLGPSGCGKSTLMRAVVGAQVVESGSVRVLGAPAGSPELRSRVGYVTQAPSVYADLTVREGLDYFAVLLGAPPGQVRDVVEAVGLSRHAGTLVRRLSGGERARVSLAAALLGRPELLVLDEPTVGLDPVLRRDLWQLFGELARGGCTLLVSSHVMDEAERCERLLLMRDGRFLADASAAELLTTTSTDDVESAFLALVERQGGALV
ncbi:ABC-2 type transport system ATP-binding protein [Motilibacter peucedani]|uniref:ABC-2 type transport system ATP-binding protein n=1 Tax=Motilibacter peucedani TaxID=598650 RepID=A0A420XPP0_9ACTN|nr:ABC transporter ATP-binding protein [Motilibacter peucedani]RKS75233.1 ABC-2 type transport system ATP-binding protein [Motilibacter peucedani]